MPKNKQRLIVISGLSGAGKTVALHTLEDSGFYCIDNLPIGLLNEFGHQLTELESIPAEEIAVGIDARNPEHLIASLPESIESLKQQNLSVELVYIEANDDVLTTRYSETRRKHPLSSDAVSLTDAIKKERRIMEQFSESADLRIDTSLLSMYGLRDLVREQIVNHPTEALSVQFVSFGYKNGVPKDADFVFDTRCLPNPYWEKDLRLSTGKDKAVIEFLENQDLVKELYAQLKDFVSYWTPHFEASNRSYLCFAIGCTGGQHR
ncbi:MAG: RNase adapter RapZ, partial [Gammaproteobacteria bacterium]|nr:RNase adapter RapZ [Gammaproteobacteria bacterium]